MDLKRLLMLSGQITEDSNVISESRDEYEEIAEELWGENVVSIEEIFSDYAELYSYVDSDMHIDNTKLSAIKGVVDAFDHAVTAKATNGDYTWVGLDKEEGGKEAAMAINRGLDALEQGDMQGIELLRSGYEAATKAVINMEDFMDRYSSEIGDTYEYRNTDRYAYYGVSRSDFI